MNGIKKVMQNLLIRRLILPSSHFVPYSAYTTLEKLHEENLFKGYRHYCHASENGNLNKGGENTSVSGDSSATTSSDSNATEEGDEQDMENKLRSKILDASLNYVNIYGWSSASISKGAEDVGYSSMAHGMFNNGTELVNYFYGKCNKDFEEYLRDSVENNNEYDIKVAKKKFIRDALEVRLRMNENYLDKWTQALVIHANPLNAPQAIKNLGTIADHIWYYAGDRSYDFNWYTKRASLVALYKIAELSMLQDKSPGLQDTFASLDRRMSDLESFSTLVKEVGVRSEDIRNLGKATIITALNIMGMNSKSR